MRWISQFDLRQYGIEILVAENKITLVTEHGKDIPYITLLSKLHDFGMADLLPHRSYVERNR